MKNKEEKQAIQNSKEIVQEVKNPIINKTRIYKWVYYVLLFILCISFRGSVSDIEIILGDFGSILPVLLKVVSIAGITWCPIFCVIGSILVFFDMKYKELNKIYLILTAFITVCSFLLLFII